MKRIGCSDIERAVNGMTPAGDWSIMRLTPQAKARRRWPLGAQPWSQLWGTTAAASSSGWRLNNGLTTWYGYLGYSASGTNDAYDATWGQFGRLWRICTAPHASNRCTFANRDTTPVEQRLDLRYAYDNVGNVTTHTATILNSNQIKTSATTTSTG
jgi:hypothetical protein